VLGGQGPNRTGSKGGGSSIDEVARGSSSEDIELLTLEIEHLKKKVACYGSRP
jgi:hypothetical protein